MTEQLKCPDCGATELEVSTEGEDIDSDALHIPMRGRCIGCGFQWQNQPEYIKRARSKAVLGAMNRGGNTEEIPDRAASPGVRHTETDVS